MTGTYVGTGFGDIDLVNGVTHKNDITPIINTFNLIGTLIGGATATFLPPVGTVCGWAKSLTNTPALSANWVECNGQTISDGDSPYDGVAVPNLNASGGGTQRFLRGNSASGATGGAETHAHALTTAGTALRPDGVAGVRDVNTDSSNHLPPYYEVVWVMRIK